jgi:GntR family transcriptional regulator, trigonelline degradation regulator
MDTAAMIAITRTPAPLRHQVVDGLRQAIISGRLRPGQRLTERELIAMMSVSRTVIREALRQLESEGLVAIVPNKGPVVRELSWQEASDLYRIRAALEGLAARLFVEKGTPSDLHQLEVVLEEVEAAYDGRDAEEILQAKNRFYDVLNRGARSEPLATMVEMLRGRVWRWRALGLAHPERSPGRSRQSVDNLKAVVAAIKARQPDLAERLMREETDRAAEEVARLLHHDTGPGADTGDLNRRD